MVYILHELKIIIIKYHHYLNVFDYLCCPENSSDLDIRTKKTWTLLANGQFYEDGCYRFMMQFDLYNGLLLSENNIQFAKLTPILETPM